MRKTKNEFIVSLLTRQIKEEKAPHDNDSLNFLHLHFAPENIKDLLKQIQQKSITPLKATDYSSFLNEDRGLFSWEFQDNGQRTFFVESYENVFKLFNYLPEYHLYEVIPENKPCHLYFDIEYYFEEHPNYDGDLIIKHLIKVIEEKLFEVFGRDEFEVIHLDATNPQKKFSRHLIIRGKDFCFKNNYHVGHFVKTEILTIPEFSIVDEAVYSKNRCIRCIWSTKVANGNKFPLVPKDYTNLSPSLSSVDFFKKTLIACVDKKCHIIGYPDLNDTPHDKPKSQVAAASTNVSQSQMRDITVNDINDFAIKCFAPTGYIKMSDYNPDFDTILMYVEGSRYCQNIKREHKSNHIYLVCSLQKGTIVQRCLDPDCRGFQSEPVQVPEHLLESLRKQFTRTQQNNVNEEIFKPKKDFDDFLDDFSDDYD
ncbi:DNA-directed primase/polymerase protein isoform X1 [Histomonas meleagridis]|uniref:DNA-directed primase/polymerase protein isoform X1 n=1 Tax=Histomonas meleagridis TaxID=135588 RepID=UPI00355A4B06|nr:DNA-directed primase/polymerase protein isoform X1 [Histomonas meleagridis]KAH0805497.1 DNA-directed primase/polymerase protein isoform X1 [Histomonas meleagridis]